MPDDTPSESSGSAAAFNLGAVLGQYRIVRLLGRGGMGEVYEVEHTVLRRRYALKLLPPAFADAPGALERFQREARVMATLDAVRFFFHSISPHSFTRWNLFARILSAFCAFLTSSFSVSRRQK